MKYIVIRVTTNKGTEYDNPIVFPETLIHTDMSKAISYLYLSQDDIVDVDVISAGFYNNIQGQGCHGRSETLDLDSRGVVDTDLINEHWATQGMVITDQENING